MYERLVTKSGDVLWHGAPKPKLGRHELARIEFEKWERKRNRSNNATTS